MESCENGEWICTIVKIEDMLAPAHVAETIFTPDDEDFSLDDIVKVFVVKPRAQWVDEF